MASANGRRHRWRSGAATSLQMVKEIHFPHSLGLLYAAFTAYTGFRVNSGEYKMMGLAPYGEPRLRTENPGQSDRREAGRQLSARSKLFQLLHRAQHDELALPCAVRRRAARRERPADATRHGSRRLDPGGDRRGRAAAHAFNRRARPGARNLCLAGGVALNCVANGKIVRDGKFDTVWVQPAAGDAGGALGAALAAYHLYLNQPRLPHQHARRDAGLLSRPGFHSRPRSSGASRPAARYLR